jgi:eukaryotic-like serine/threonine-protein kinase
MQNENWKKVKDLLDEVLQIETSERQNFLENSGVSAEVRAEVESLLAFEEESEDLMHLSAVEFSKDFFDGESENALIGQQIGNYKIVSELGYGGMGAVYLATRTDGKFKQKVALKLLKREMNTAALRRRFQQEREILASLEHPNIARLLDAGTTDDKIPFLAMEYVEGLPIDDYCNLNNLDLSQRLDLFRKVCSTVNFAHRNLIVHRDLKPSNILVNEEGTPKLLDFGISKILSAEFEQLNSATVTKLGVMTPGYASPEQLQSKSVTTATDIYSLGVILYELLSGHRPFESKESDLKEIYKAVLETEPTPPSVVIADFGFGIADSESKTVPLPVHTKNQHKETNPQSAIRNPQLKGDLDNIVLKALRKEPERRYSSAENLAEDIHRHQRGLPVTARPNTFSYRAEKFFKRNQLSVIAGVLLLVAVIAGIAATLWQSKIAAAERDRARIEAEKAKKINEYMKNVLNFSNPHWLSSNPGRNSKATIAEAMDEGLKNIDNDLAGEPEIQAEILFTISQTYTVRGQYDKAETLLRQALEKFSQVPGDINPKSMQASVILADTLFFKGQYAESKKLYLEAIDYFRPLVEKDKSQLKWLIIALNDLGNVYSFEGKYEDTKKVVTESLEYSANLTGKDRYVIPIVMGNYGFLLYNIGDFQTSLIYYDKSYEEMQKMGTEQSYEAGQVLSNIGRSYIWMGEYELADKNLRQAYDILKNTVGEKDAYLLTTSSLIALNLHNQGKYSEAQEEIEKVIKIQREIYPNGHIFMAAPLRILGDIYTKTNKLKDGEEKIKTSLELYFKSLKEPNAQISQAKTSLGENLIAQKRYAEAKDTLTTALDGYIKTRGENHPFTKQCREILSKIPN